MNNEWLYKLKNKNLPVFFRFNDINDLEFPRAFLILSDPSSSDSPIVLKPPRPPG